MNLGNRSTILYGGLLLNLLYFSVLSQSPEGFISIDCGGLGGIDLITNLEWINDGTTLDSYDQLSKENVTISADVQYDASAASMANGEWLKTALVFLPNQASRSKFCYTLPIVFNETEGARNYLLRVMFPSKEMTEGGNSLPEYATRFYFTVDSTYITTVELLASAPLTIELVISSLDDHFFVCLVPLEDKSSMPAISTLELRPFNVGTYSRTGQSKDKQQSSYLMLVDRLDFGGSTNVTSPSLRYPNDPFDRIWTSPQIPEDAEFVAYNRTDNELSLGYGGDNVRFPKDVMRTIWRGKNLTSVIQFLVDIKRARALHPLPTFWVQMLYSNIVSGAVSPTQRVQFNDGGLIWFWTDFSPYDTPGFNQLLSNDQVINSDSVTFQVIPNVTVTTEPVLINGAEIHGEFAAVALRTSKLDVDAIKNFSTNLVSKPLDTAGDPCLPVPWDWLVCSIELPPRITQINLTKKGVSGGLDLNFSALNRLTILDLSNNGFNGTIPSSLGNVSTLRALDVSGNNLTGELPPFAVGLFAYLETLSFSNNRLSGNLISLVRALNTSVIYMDLSNNSFSGPIPMDIVKLKNLESLDLSRNLLFGPLPVDLDRLDNLKNLYLNDNSLSGAVTDTIWNSTFENINLENNNFTELNLTTWYYLVRGKNSFSASAKKVRLLENPISRIHIPSFDALNNFTRPSQSELQTSEQNNTSFILLGGSPWCKAHEGSKRTLVERYLCRTNEAEDFWPPKKSGNRTLLIVSTTVGTVALLLAVIFSFFLWKSWKRIRNLQQIQDALAKEDVRPPFFKYEELKTATKDFSKHNELGKGAFGAVYKAVLADGTTLAVKRLFPTHQNVAEFFKEMVLISGIKHRNLIQLKGCCVREKERMLVYEYAENQNLAEALWGQSRCVLNWEQRLKIAVGIARGLSYLHEELQPKIIHRDIKPQNILLDQDFNAKIADFGLARPATEDKTQLATRIGGTQGYFSPEYATLGMFTEKLDVYSFGVLLLEIVAGRPCIQPSLSAEQIYLRVWAVYLSRRDKLIDMLDDDLVGKCSQEEVMSVVKVALACVQQDPENRPSMSHVVNMLTGSADLAIDLIKEISLHGENVEGRRSPMHNEGEEISLISANSAASTGKLIELSPR